MISIAALLLAGLAFQGAGESQIAGVTERVEPAAPVLSPKAVAANNPDLTNQERGDIMMARKMYRDAIDFYKLEADDDPIMANKTGMAYHQLGDLGNAKKYYDKAIKLDKNYAEAINNRGTVQYARKSYYRAMKDYEKALKINPTSATIWMNLGTAQFARKKFDDAFTYYAYALSLDPLIFERRGGNGSQIQERSVEDRGRFYYLLAKTYAQAGIVDNAIRYIRFALENGFEDRDKFIKEDEFAILQENVEFQELMVTEFEVL